MCRLRMALHYRAPCGAITGCVALAGARQSGTRFRQRLRKQNGLVLPMHKNWSANDRPPRFSMNWPLRTLCISSMPARIARAARNDLKPSIGLVGAALIHRKFVWYHIVPHRLLEKAPGCSRMTPGSQQRVDRLALLVDCRHRYFHAPLTLIYVSFILQLAPTACLYFRKTFSSNCRNRIVQRLIKEWSTTTPRSCIISSRCR